MGSASAQFKGFMDATSRTVFAKGGKWANKVAAGFTNSASRSGDKLATLQQIAIFAAQHGMHWVNLGLPPGHNNSKSTEDSLNRHGFFLAPPPSPTRMRAPMWYRRWPTCAPPSIWVHASPKWHSNSPPAATRSPR